MCSMKRPGGYLLTYLDRWMREGHTPHLIGLSFAIGSFISILPTLGLGVFLALLVSFFYVDLNKLALLAPFLVFNFFTQTPLYFFSYRLGNWILGAAPVMKYNISFWNQIYNFTMRFLLGNLIVSAVVSLIGYFIVKSLARRYLVELYTDQE